MLRIASLCVIVGATVVAVPAHAQRWERLGCQTVGFITDRDVIRVGGNEGRFSAIRLEVERNDIEMRDLKVTYGNGNVDDLSVRQTIRAGGQSRAIDLKGRQARRIRQISMVYRSRPSFRGQAIVCASGRTGR